MIYFLTALCCFVFANRAPRAFWWTIVGLLILIGLSSVTNLLQYTTTLGRSIAYEYGWYRARRSWQALGIASIPIGSLVVIILLLRTQLKRLRAPEWLALLAMGGLCNLIVIRAISFHDVDQLLGRQLFGIQLNRLFETLILLCIVAASFWAGRRLRAHPPDSSST